MDLHGPLIVGVDGSDEGYWALNVAGEWGCAHGHRLVVVHVPLPSRYMMAVSVDPTSAAEAKMLGTASETADDCRFYAGVALDLLGVSWSFELGGSDPAATLLAAAERHEAQAIVIGRRWHWRHRRGLTGPVTKRLVRASHIPVIIVPPPNPGRE